MYLRARKYQMDRVFDAFEKNIVFIRQHANWFDWEGEKLQRALDLYDDGFLKVMKHHDSQGRRIMLVNNDVDMNKYNADDVFRLHFLVFTMLILEEDTQYCGIIYIDDFSDAISMKYLAMFPMNSIYDFASQLKSAPLRMKEICVIGLPTFASQIFSVIKLGLTDVMKERMHVLETKSQLWTTFDRKIFTRDFGGEADVKENMAYFRKVIEENVERAVKIFDFDIDLTKALAHKNIQENIGTFRKLEID